MTTSLNAKGASEKEVMEVIDVTGIDNIGRPVDLSFTPYYIKENKLEYRVGLTNEFNGSGYWSRHELRSITKMIFLMSLLIWIGMDRQPWKFLTITEFQ